MKDKDLLDVLTVTGWAMWLRYTKQNNVKKDKEGNWPEYDVHGFMTVLGIGEDDVIAVEENIPQLELPIEEKPKDVPPTVHGLINPDLPGAD